MGSLPESYENFISNLYARKLHLKWGNVKNLLVEEYKKRNEKQTSPSSVQNDALMSRRDEQPARERNRFRAGRQYGNHCRESDAQNQRRSNNQMRI